MVDFAKHMRLSAKKESSTTIMERQELMAELFHASTGFLAPGKSVPAETASEQYEIDRQHAWREWTDSKALAMALQFITALRAERDEYDQLYAALETCDTNQIMQERDALRLRIKAVDEEHVQLAEERKKMIEAYTIVEVDRDLWKKEHEGLMLTVFEMQRKIDLSVSVAREEVFKAREERDFYKRMWAIRGKALEQPCLGCGYTGQAIRLKNGEIP